MFNSLLGPKFSNKCKHSVKCIKCRMETIRKKKHAMERCLKKDIADLVSTGHDANAFGRMDALLFEINQRSCYDMIEQYCCCILEYLPAMQKERECPKETAEAVATLIFAAARFSDLPELANLRRGFTERYRTSMESYTNKEFVEKLQKKSFTQDEKLQLMKDIAKEFTIDWDVRSFEYKMSNPSAPIIDHSKIDFRSSNKNYIESHITDERRKVTDRKNEGDEHHSRSAVQKHRVQTEDHRKFPKAPKNANAHDSAEKIKKVAADESENFESRHLSRRPPPYVKTIDNQNGNARKQSEDHEGPGLVRDERRGTARNDKAINMFPLDSTFREDFNGTYSSHDASVHSTQCRSHRTYIDQTVHGRRSINATYDRTGTREPHTQSIFDPSRVVEKTIEDEQYSKLSAQTPTRTVSLPPTETLVGRHARSVQCNLI